MLRMLIAGLAVATLAGTAAAADRPVPLHHAYGPVPTCDAPGVLTRITEKFAYQDARITHTGLAIADIDGIAERWVRAGGPGFIDRRYCTATAYLSDGRASEVVYLIEGPKLGTFSIGWSVESCLTGFDPQRVYNARCRSIRP